MERSQAAPVPGQPGSGGHSGALPALKARTSLPSLAAQWLRSEGRNRAHGRRPKSEETGDDGARSADEDADYSSQASKGSSTAIPAINAPMCKGRLRG